MTVIESISPNTTVADLAVRYAGASRVLHRHDLDFCCHGHVSMERACADANLDANQILREIEAEAPADPNFEAWNEQSLDALLEHILVNFHEAHRQELPRLIEMARKVERVHAEKASCPKGLAAHLEFMHEELEAHMQKEEQVLFPLIKAGRGSMAQMPVQVMEQEHRDHGKNLERMRELAQNFEAPDEACGTWRALFLGVAELERDLMNHIHLENNILFPRALRS
ncbi:MAG: regulator of cell morphogenesis and NO signaling [Planctomycetota bacterium]|jgi:regulator of cell morphogenesis and NO signaling